MQTTIIQNRIHEIRGQKVMLDFDLAGIYEVQTKVLNQAVKRNSERFPEDFMFRLTSHEWTTIRSQIVTASSSVGTQQKRNTSQMPYAFTEHGVTMLANVLRSSKAISMGITVVRAFVALRRIALQNIDLAAKLNELTFRVDEHDTQLKAIYDAIENLLDKKVEEKTWEEREMIGFKK